MASTRYESRGLLVGSFPSIPKTPPSTSGFRTKWHTLSSSARGLLCFYPPGHAYRVHKPSNSKVALHTPARRNLSMHQSSSRGSTAPLNVARSKSYQVHTEKFAKHERREAVATWDDKRSTAMKSSPTGNKLSLGAAVSVNAPLIEERGARQRGLPSPLYDDHAVAPPHFNGTQARAEGREPHIHIATGETVDALIDALFQIGDYEECDSVASLGTPSPLSAEVGLEKATEDKPMEVGEKEKKTKKRFTAAWEEVAARRAWEDVKRRVMHVEEYGALAPDDVGDADAMDHDAERASREFRARRRRGWAEEAIRGRAREEAGQGVAAKKRRRDAGCWVREDGVFMRLYARRM